MGRVRDMEGTKAETLRSQAWVNENTDPPCPTGASHGAQPHTKNYPQKKVEVGKKNKR